MSRAHCSVLGDRLIIIRIRNHGNQLVGKRPSVKKDMINTSKLPFRNRCDERGRAHFSRNSERSVQERSYRLVRLIENSSGVQQNFVSTVRSYIQHFFCSILDRSLDGSEPGLVDTPKLAQIGGGGVVEGLRADFGKEECTVVVIFSVWVLSGWWKNSFFK